MRRSTIALFALAATLLVGAAAAQYIAIRSTQGSPSRSCAEDGPLRVTFGEPVAREGGLDIPVLLTNVGNTTERALIHTWEVDVYRVRWDGRLSGLGTQATNIDYIAGYTGEDITPGGTMRLGDVQISDGADKFRVVAFAEEACGDQTIER